MLYTKEHQELMQMFERIYKAERLEREDKSDWASNRIYQDGTVNKLFLAFRQGVAYGKAIA